MSPNNRNITDDQIISALLGLEEHRNEIFKYLYISSGWRNWVIEHVRQNGGDDGEGEDVFQETVILFDRNIREGNYKSNSTLKTYFLGIAKQYWFNKKRSRKNHLPLADVSDDSQIESPESLFLNEEKRNIMNQILATLGTQCREILSLYKLSFSNQEIADKLNLTNQELAKKYTYRCREKLRAFLATRKDLMSYFNVKNL